MGSRFWAMFDDDGGLICVYVYRLGAISLVRLILGLHLKDAPFYQSSKPAFFLTHIKYSAAAAATGRSAHK